MTISTKNTREVFWKNVAIGAGATFIGYIVIVGIFKAGLGLGFTIGLGVGLAIAYGIKKLNEDYLE